MKRFSVVALFAASVALPVLADESHHKAPAGASPKAAQAAKAEGEIRRVDRERERLTIRHGALPELDMPDPMSMVYRVQDASMLDRVKVGDKVRFEAAKVNGAFTVTRLEPASP